MIEKQEGRKRGPGVRVEVEVGVRVGYEMRHEGLQLDSGLDSDLEGKKDEVIVVTGGSGRWVKRSRVESTGSFVRSFRSYGYFISSVPVPSLLFYFFFSYLFFSISFF